VASVHQWPWPVWPDLSRGLKLLPLVSYRILACHWLSGSHVSACSDIGHIWPRNGYHWCFFLDKFAIFGLAQQVRNWGSWVASQVIFKGKCAFVKSGEHPDGENNLHISTSHFPLNSTFEDLIKRCEEECTFNLNIHIPSQTLTIPQASNFWTFL
jgi:hypothetical protein